MRRLHRTALRSAGALALASALVAGDVRPAEACGCFTPPDPTVPIVQAGERIVFQSRDNETVAHIQIQYQGDAKEFGWLLPVPSLPKLELGTDELFTQLTAQTQPKYRLTRIFPQGCQGKSAGTGFGTPGVSDMGAAAPGEDGRGPLVFQDSIGPYDYAVLKADSKEPMLKWLADNHYFVPAGTDTVVGPYLHPGAYFLALKLKSGKSTGDLQPVVVRYGSDRPMIPIVLTSTAAQPHMGIQVFMVGDGRAIPRNYYHTVVNDAAIDWSNGGQNYNDVIIRATGEAPGRHAFVTEYAGPSSVMKDVLDGNGRFGDVAELAKITDARLYGQFLRTYRYPFTSTLVAILRSYIPMPQSLIAKGVLPAQYYGQLDYWLGGYRQQNPDEFKGLDFSYDAARLTDEVVMRVVKPTRDAAKLFTANTYLTRLYTTLSPEDMTSDPVFSFNPDLPPVPNVHEGKLYLSCDPTGYATLVTADGFTLAYPAGRAPASLPRMPASLRIEKLMDSGAAQVVTDNRAVINGALGYSSGCSVGQGASPAGGMLALGLLVGLGLFVARRRREVA